jgi:preprotein translocase subunit Sss1
MSYEILVGIGVGACFVGILGYKGLELLIKKVMKNKLKNSTNKVVGQETLDAIHLGLLDYANTNGRSNTEWANVLEMNKPISEEEFNHIVKVQRAKTPISKKDIKLSNKTIKV